MTVEKDALRSFEEFVRAFTYGDGIAPLQWLIDEYREFKKYAPRVTGTVTGSVFGEGGTTSISVDGIEYPVVPGTDLAGLWEYGDFGKDRICSFYVNAEGAMYQEAGEA